MNNKKSISVLALISLCGATALAACASKGPKKIEMTLEEALALVGSDTALANDATTNNFSQTNYYVYDDNAAVYLGLSLTDQTTGEEIDPASYDVWGYKESAVTYYTDKVLETSNTLWTGDETKEREISDDYLYSTTSEQVYYVNDETIGVFDDSTYYVGEEGRYETPVTTSGLSSLWGQAYCDWWDMTYGKYSAAYVGMYTMEDYDNQYFGHDDITPNATSLANIQVFETIFDDVEGATEENGYESSIIVDAYSDYTTVTCEAIYPLGYTLGDFEYLDGGNGYSGWVDADLWMDMVYTAKFDTTTGLVTTYSLEQDYFIKTNPNTGATLEESQNVEYQCSEITVEESVGAFNGAKREITNFDLGFYGSFFKDADHYWFITWNQYTPCPYQVDLTAAKLNKALTDGFSWSNAPTYNKNSNTVTFTGAKSHAYTDSEGAPQTMKYDYTMSLDENGNLVVSYNNGTEDVTETYYSKANFNA